VPEETVSVDLTLRGGYAFDADLHLEGLSPLLLDETPPLGEGSGPSPARLLAAAVGHCMSASLLFCLRRSRVDVSGVETHVEADLERNERGRLRVGAIRVRLTPSVTAQDAAKLERCMSLFEDFCIVGQSVRAGVDVKT
jgi:organic hydroperoxide reductase OsmC/OhrA